MRQVFLCLLVSLVGHLLVFPDVMQAIIGGGDQVELAVPKSRMRVRLVEKKVAPKPRKLKRVAPPVVRARKKRRRRRSLKENPRTVKARQVVPKARPVVPRARTVVPRAPVAKKKRRSKTRRVLTAKRVKGTKRVAAAPRPLKPEPAESKPIEPEPLAEGETEPGGPMGEPSAPLGEPDREPPGPAGEPEAPSSEPVETSLPPASEPTPIPERKPNSAPKPKPKPKSTPKPKRAARSTPLPLNRKVGVEFPEELRLPAKFRRKNLETEVRVRAVVGKDGRAQLSLRSASGHEEIDDYILEQIREMARFTPATDASGGPKRGRATFTVKIVVD